MRLFFAINFDEEMTDALWQSVGALQQARLQGRFSRRENLHLTLAFIGETTRGEELLKILQQLDAAPFKLALGRCGLFRRSGGSIFWRSLRESAELKALQAQLTGLLAAHGFEVDSREFRPHITLAREVYLQDDFDLPAFSARQPQAAMTVRRISLMRSDRINGRLTYTEVGAKELK
jgi:2'-5' RNA ligase